MTQATIDKRPRLQINTPNRDLNRRAEAIWSPRHSPRDSDPGANTLDGPLGGAYCCGGAWTAEKTCGLGEC